MAHLSGTGNDSLPRGGSLDTGLCSWMFKKELFKEHSQAAVTVLRTSVTRSLLVADCTEKLTALSENRVSIIRTPGPSGIT